MLFEARLRDGLLDGSITVAYRRWVRSQVKPGGRYRTGPRHGVPGPLVEAVSVSVVNPARITKADARRAGYPSTDALLAGLGRRTELPLYRIEFMLVDEPDPRSQLAAAAALDPTEVAALRERLARIDAAASDGVPWTGPVLALIADNPGVLAAELAAELGLEKLFFKRRVRVLKELGLTISLPIGYELSPRGQAYLDLTSAPPEA